MVIPRGSLTHTFGGDDGNRTHDPLLAGQVLSQLSYTPGSICLSVKSLKIEQQFLIGTLGCAPCRLVIVYLKYGNHPQILTTFSIERR